MVAAELELQGLTGASTDSLKEPERILLLMDNEASDHGKYDAHS